MNKTSDFVEEYNELINLLERFKIEIHSQLKILIEEIDIYLGFPIQCRVKEISSLQEKINSGRFKPEKSITELQDLIGFRIILLFSRDVNPTIEAIRKHFKIIELYDTVDRLENNQFGYSSKHIVFQIPDDWLSVPSLAKFGNLKAEIQVRTISQHLWSEASHKLQYKKESNVPKNIQRSINRVSAILELVDIEFERVLVDRTDYASEINEHLDKIEESLNVDSLKAVLTEKMPKYISDSENYSELLDDIEVLGYGKRQDFLELIEKHLGNVIDFDRDLVKKMTKEIENGNERPTVNGYSVMSSKTKNRILDKKKFFTVSGVLRNMLSKDLGESWSDVKKRKTVDNNAS